MKTNKNIRTIKGFNKGIFKALNIQYGFDFEKPFDVFEIKTPFTLAKVEKAIAPKYSTLGRGRDRVAVILHYPEGHYYRSKRTYSVEVIGTGAGDFNIDHNYHIDSRVLDWFYRKGDFNDARKDEDVRAYIIAQSGDNLAKRYTAKPVDRSERLTAKQLDNFSTSTRNEYDKSGYYFGDKQRNLINKAKALRIERKKAAFAATDNTAKIEELKKRAELAKMIICGKLELATTCDEIRKIDSALGYFDGLRGIYSDLEELTTGEREKSFSSIESFERLCDCLESKVKKVIAWEY